jgi:3D (Asp-Asp-Asp) domain-containing protein
MQTAAQALAIALSVAPVADGKPVEVRARITYYDPQSCRYHRQTSTGARATEGRTVAVDPRLIPYGSRIEIPGLRGIVGTGIFRAEDTGSAVKSRKASKAWGSKAPVVDVFVSTRARLKEVEKAAPMFLTVRVYPAAPSLSGSPYGEQKQPRGRLPALKLQTARL